MAKRCTVLSFLAAALLSLFVTTAAYASFEQGKDAYDRKDWKQAIFFLRPLAEQGDDRAMIVLGNMYSQGLGVGQDDQEAFLLYKKAALKNNPDAMAAVGAMYQKGRGIGRNIPLAAAWYRRAAESGQRAAAILYAMLMYRGNKSDNPAFALQPDHLESYKWFSLAANQAQTRAQQDELHRMAAKVAEKIANRDLARIDGEVTVWKPLAADKLGPYPEETLALPPAEEKKPD